MSEFDYPRNLHRRALTRARARERELRIVKNAEPELKGTSKVDGRQTATIKTTRKSGDEGSAENGKDFTFIGESAKFAREERNDRRLSNGNDDIASRWIAEGLDDKIY